MANEPNARIQQDMEMHQRAQVSRTLSSLSNASNNRQSDAAEQTQPRNRKAVIDLEESCRMEDIQTRMHTLTKSLIGRPFYTAPRGDRLKVFISSDMVELYDVRELVAKALSDRGIDAWIHENHAGARPESVVETSLRAAEGADMYVGLFWRKYGEVTVEEYRHSRNLNRPCFVYVRDRTCNRDPKLEAFLRAEVYDPRRGVNYDFFDSAVSVGKQVSDDIMAWLVCQHREMMTEIEWARAVREEVASLWEEMSRLRFTNQEKSV